MSKCSSHGKVDGFVIKKMDLMECKESGNVCLSVCLSVCHESETSWLLTSLSFNLSFNLFSSNRNPPVLWKIQFCDRQCYAPWWLGVGRNISATGLGKWGCSHTKSQTRYRSKKVFINRQQHRDQQGLSVAPKKTNINKPPPPLQVLSTQKYSGWCSL